MTSSRQPTDADAPVDAPLGANPFVGPRPFQSGERLFGRGKETRELYYLLSAERIVWLHSPSGAGKSSLIWASLAPRLARDGFAVCPSIRVGLDLPGMPPAANRYLMSTLLSLDEGLPAGQRQSVAALAGQSLHGYLAGRLAAGRAAGSAGTLLVFDQFEEILTVDPLDQGRKRAFFQALGEALRDPGLWALFALREEYLAQLEPYVDCIPTRWSNSFRLAPLGREAVLEVLARTAASGGRSFAEPAALALFADLARTRVQQPDGSFGEEAGRHVEPVQLQVVCRRLWDCMPAEDRTIEPEDLARFADVSQALGSYYDDSLERIAAGDPALERRIRDWLGHRLIAPTGIRTQVPRAADASEGLPNPVIERLLDTHLVRGEKRAGATWYELAHDRLIAPVRNSNRAWLAAHLQPFQRRAAVWVAQGRPANGGDHCLRGRALRTALAWQRANPSLVSEDESRLLAISRAAHGVRRWTRAGIAFVVLLSLVFGSVAWSLKTEAEQKEREAWYQLAIVNWLEAGEQRAHSPLKAAHNLALAAGRFAWARSPDESTNTQIALKRVVDRPLLLAATAPPGADGAVFSADGTRLLAWGRDGTARLWDSRTGEPLGPPLRHAGPVAGAQWSAEESRLLSWSEDGTARLWDARTGAALVPPLRQAGAVLGAAFGADGTRILTWDEAGTARLWDAGTGAATTPALRHAGPVWGAELAADDRRLLTWGQDGTARLWDAGTGGTLLPPLRHGAPVHGARIDATGTRILTWGDDGLVRLWDGRTGAAIATLRHSRPAGGARFSPDGSRVLTWGDDGAARLWDSDQGRAVPPALRHNGHVTGADFDASGARILTWCEDGTARLWDGRTGAALTAPLRHDGPVTGARLSADGARVLTWGRDRTARLWDSRDGRSLALPFEHPTAVASARFSRDGQRVLAWGLDGSARIWDASVATVPAVADTQGASGAQPDPASLRVVAADDDGTIQLRDRRTGAAIATALAAAGPVDGVKVIGNGQSLVTWNEQGIARLWDSRTGEPLGAPLQQGAPIFGAEFNRDGSRLLTWSWDGGARLRDSRTGEPVAPPLRHDSSVCGARFSEDGSRLLTWSWNGTARLWDSRTGEALTPPLDRGGWVQGAELGRDGSRILIWSEDGSAQLLDGRTGARLASPPKHDTSIEGARLTRNGARVFAWSQDGAARIWDSATGRTVALPFDNDTNLADARFSADETRLLTRARDGTARLWDSRTGAPLAPPLKEAGWVRDTQISADGARILTWNEEGTARLWGSRTGEPLTPPLADASGGARFNADESAILTRARDGTERVWDIAIDRAWPPEKIVLRTEVETGTALSAAGELKALSAARWQRERWCDYDAVRHDLGRLSEGDWAESQRMCGNSR